VATRHASRSPSSGSVSHSPLARTRRFRPWPAIRIRRVDRTISTPLPRQGFLTAKVALRSSRGTESLPHPEPCALFGGAIFGWISGRAAPDGGSSTSRRGLRAPFRSAFRASAPATDRWDRVDQADHLGDVVAVSRGERRGGGTPLPSVIRWCFDPARPRSTGGGPVRGHPKLRVSGLSQSPPASSPSDRPRAAWRAASREVVAIPRVAEAPLDLRDQGLTTSHSSSLTIGLAMSELPVRGSLIRFADKLHNPLFVPSATKLVSPDGALAGAFNVRRCRSGAWCRRSGARSSPQRHPVRPG
jgi:hypothetical protein